MKKAAKSGKLNSQVHADIIRCSSNGGNLAELARQIGVSRQAVHQFVVQQRRRDSMGITEVSRGRPKCIQLTAEQWLELRVKMRRKTPSSLMLGDSDSWTLESAMELVRGRYGGPVPKAVLRQKLREWRLIPEP